MIEFNYSILNNTANGVLNFDALTFERGLLELPETLLSIQVNGDNLKFQFESSQDVGVLDVALDALVLAHQGTPKPYHKIYDFVIVNILGGIV